MPNVLAKVFLALIYFSTLSFRDVEEDCFWFEKYFWWRNSNFGDEMECDVGTPHVHLEWITASEIKSIHEQLETLSSPFCQEISSLADRMEKKSK